MTFCKLLVLLLFKERDTENLVAVKLKCFVFVTYLKIIIYMLFEFFINSYSHCFTAELPDECMYCIIILRHFSMHSDSHMQR